MAECKECGNQLSPNAKTCGNPQCSSSDPFGKEKRKKRLSRVIGTLMIVAACGFYITQYGLTNPIDIFQYALLGRQSL